MAWQLDTFTAKAIIAEAQAQEVFAGPMPDAGQLIEEAVKLLALADEAYDNGVRGDHVVRIRSMGESHRSPDPVEPESEEQKGSMGLKESMSQERAQSLPTPHDVPTPERAEAERMVTAHGFPIPTHPDGEPPEMPRDLTQTGDKEARRLHSEFNAWLNRLQYVIGLERADADSAERLADFHEAQALRKTDSVDENGDKVPQHVRLAIAKGDAEAAKWRQRATQHNANLKLLYALKDAYAGNIERLKQDWRMRSDEFQFGGGAGR